MIDTNEPIETIEDERSHIQFNPNVIALMPEFQLPANATIQERMTMARLVATFLGKATRMDDCYNATVQVAGVLMHPARLTDTATGEVREGTRVVWLLDNASTLSGFSAVTKQFTESVLMPIFNDGKQGLLKYGPVPVKIESQKTNSGRKTYSFSIEEKPL